MGRLRVDMVVKQLIDVGKLGEHHEEGEGSPDFSAASGKGGLCAVAEQQTARVPSIDGSIHPCCGNDEHASQHDEEQVADCFEPCSLKLQIDPGGLCSLHGCGPSLPVWACHSPIPPPRPDNQR